MTETAKRYGGSLYDLAVEEQLEDRLLAELDTVTAVLRENPEYLRLLSTPSIPKKERASLLGEAFGGAVHPYLVNFLKLLCDNGILRELNGCAKEFRARYNKAHGIVEVRAVSAVALSAAEKDKLVKKLQSVTGKRIDLTVKVDPAVLGGVRLEMEGVQLDGTVRSRLEALRGDIAGAVL